MNGVKFHSDFVARGVPIVNVNLKGHFNIGKKFSMNSGKYHNMIGRQQQCYFIVNDGGSITIGDNVGVSCISIVSQRNITIGNNVRIGGGVAIYDTDFHPIEAAKRLSRAEHNSNVNTAPVHISDGAFIGAHAIILKGVTIGKNAVVGAGAVVARSIPDNEIWAGNPAKLIKKLL
ncbi:acyltransferase [Mucilaginibacter terrenus]|nr:acyltransferase [Mucilaginibacter terrenus]